MAHVVLTGDRPSGRPHGDSAPGRLHLGHYVGSLVSRLEWQHKSHLYILVADVQALTDHADRSQDLLDNIVEVAIDYLSVGIDPSKTTIFLQSMVPQIAELTVFYLNLVSVARLERNPTVKTEIAQKGFGESVPAGFLCYPVSQAADITAFKATLVPVGEDQVPVLEQTNEIVRKFNRLTQTDCLKECTAILSETPRLSGTDGRGKAGKSLGNAIYLADSPEDVRRKVFDMYTDPDHLKVSDPGRVEGNAVFSYLDAFHPDAEQVAEWKAQYTRGGLGDVALKTALNAVLQELLEPMRARRAVVTRADVLEILRAGTETAQRAAAKTMEEVRAAMGLLSF